MLIKRYIPKVCWSNYTTHIHLISVACIKLDNAKLDNSGQPLDTLIKLQIKLFKLFVQVTRIYLNIHPVLLLFWIFGVSSLMSKMSVSQKNFPCYAVLPVD